METTGDQLPARDHQIRLFAHGPKGDRTLENLVWATELACSRTGYANLYHVTLTHTPADLESTLRNREFDVYFINLDSAAAYSSLTHLAEMPHITWPFLVITGQHDELSTQLYDAQHTMPSDENFLNASKEAEQLETNLRGCYNVQYICIGHKSNLGPVTQPMQTDDLIAKMTHVLERIRNSELKSVMHPMIAKADPGQLAEWSLSWWKRARDMRRSKGSDAIVPGSRPLEQDAYVAQQHARYLRMASLLMQLAFDRKDEGSIVGKKTFNVQTTQGGGIKFRDAFAKRCMTEDAAILREQYIVNAGGQWISAPGPDRYCNDYPIIDVGHGNSVLVAEYVDGVTPRSVLRAMQTIKTTPLAKLFKKHLLRRMIHDLAHYDNHSRTPYPHQYKESDDPDDKTRTSIHGHVGPRAETRKNIRSCVDEYIKRTIDAFRSYEPTAKDSECLCDALKAMEFRSDRAFGAGHTIVVHRDSSIANCIINDTVLPETKPTDIRDILLADSSCRNNYDGIFMQMIDEPRSKSLPYCAEAYPHGEFTHIDFGHRKAFSGEDLFQIILDPDWNLTRNDAQFERLVDISLHQYAIYRVALSRLLYAFIPPGRDYNDPLDEIRPSKHRRRLRAAVNDLTNTLFWNPTARTSPEHDATLRRKIDAFHKIYNKHSHTKTVKDCVPFSSNPSDHPYHYDWMWFCRALRESYITQTHYARTMPAEEIRRITCHYLHAALLPLERMRKRYHETMLRNYPSHPAFMRFVPGQRLDVTQAREHLLQAQEAQSLQYRRQENTPALHMRRLDYLAAFTKSSKRSTREAHDERS